MVNVSVHVAALVVTAAVLSGSRDTCFSGTVTVRHTTPQPQPQPQPHYTTPHHTTPHHITPHHTTSHHTTPHRTAPHHTTPHHTTPHHTTPHQALRQLITKFDVRCTLKRRSLNFSQTRSALGQVCIMSTHTHTHTHTHARARAPVGSKYL